MSSQDAGGLPDPAIGARTRAETRDNLTAIWWMLLSVLTSSAMTLCVRELAGNMDSRAVVLWRATITLAGFVALLAVHAPSRAQLRFTHPWAHVWRGLAIGISTHLGFYSIVHLDLVTVTVLFFTAPIWASIFGVLFNGENTGPRRIAAILAGFVGVLVVLRPGMIPLDSAMLAALGSSVLFGIALTLSRRVANADGPLSVYFSSVVLMLLVSLPLAAPVMTLPQGDWGWVLLFALVGTGTIRSVADIQAYRMGEASVLAPFTYLRLVVLGLAGYLLYREVPDGWSLTGAVIIIGSALYIAHRERLARKAARA